MRVRVLDGRWLEPALVAFGRQPDQAAVAQVFGAGPDDAGEHVGQLQAARERLGRPGHHLEATRVPAHGPYSRALSRALAQR